MAAKAEVNPVAHGWNWKVYLGCETDENGRPMKGTAETIRGGWAGSKRGAKLAAREAMP